MYITKCITWKSNLTDFLFTTHLLDQLQMQQSKTSQDQGIHTIMYHNKQSQVYCKEALHNIKINAFAICICILQYMVNNTVAKIWRHLVRLIRKWKVIWYASLDQIYLTHLHVQTSIHYFFRKSQKIND